MDDDDDKAIPSSKNQMSVIYVTLAIPFNYHKSQINTTVT